MTLANAVWIAGLLLEVLCLRRLITIRTHPALAIFIGWQLLMDVAAAFLTPFAFWGTVYWLGHSITYVLLLFIFMPFRVRTISGTYWLTTLSLTVLAVTGMWLFEPWKQYQLGLVCSGLELFAAAVTYFSKGLWMPRAAWIGTALIASGQAVASIFPCIYGIVYPVSCAIALAFFLISTHSVQAAYVGTAEPLDHYRAPLHNRYNRRVLAFLQG